MLFGYSSSEQGDGVAKSKPSEFKFRKHDNVGFENAELDESYLRECYYEIGDLAVLLDCQNPRCIVLGRTGSGKSALLLEVEDQVEHPIRINPENLSLQYLSNSTILPKLEAMGVSLGLFYKLLWRHVFAVELIKAKFGLRTEADTRNFLERIWEFFVRDREKERVIDYLTEWGKEFWKDTEYRVKEVASKLETDVKSSLGVKYGGILEAQIGEGEKITLEEKGELVSRLQSVVDSIQVQHLNRVIELLGESIFAAPQPRFYVLIDRLDESWVDDKFRYRLIKALVETASEMNKKMLAVKIVIAIRQDLLDLVIQQTREPGFQAEKYEPLTVPLKWKQEQLLEMLNKRINALIQRRWSGEPITWGHLMPAKVQKIPTEEYLIGRTLYRPRDLIVFFNACIQQAQDEPKITPTMIADAESEYSVKRLRSLYDEWYAEFPELEACTDLLKKQPAHFRLSTLSDIQTGELALKLAVAEGRGYITRQARKLTDDAITSQDFLASLMTIFYRTGLVGLKTDPASPPGWSFRAPQADLAMIDEDTSVYVSPVFWRSLGVNPKTDGQGMTFGGAGKVH
jgi:hypothetical protein